MRVDRNGIDRACRTARQLLPASWDAVEAFASEFRVLCEQMSDRSDAFAAELLLREALVNAIVHGSRNDPRRHIGCAVRLGSRSLLLVVRDEGDGFDWRRQMGRVAEAGAPSGRGIEIFRRYASRFRFNRQGNVIALRRDFRESLRDQRS